MVSAQYRKSDRCAISMPSSSAITAIGTGSAKAAIRSTSASPEGSASILSRTIPRIHGSNAATRRGVNVCCTRPRSRV